MGCAGSPFGRNIPMAHTYREEPAQLLESHPHLISQRVLNRQTFQPAATLNLPAGAWIQFECMTGSAPEPHRETMGPGGGGTMTTNGIVTITQYEYPVRRKGHRAGDGLATGFLRDTRAHTNLIPHIEPTRTQHRHGRCGNRCWQHLD